VTPRLSGAEIRRILVFRLGGLGDHIVALPVVNALRARFPEATMGLLTNLPYQAGVIQNHSLFGTGFFEHYFNFTSGARELGPIAALWRDLRRFKPDLIVNLTPRRSIGPGLRDRLFLASLRPKAYWGAPIHVGRDNLPLDPGERWEAESARLSRFVSRHLDVSLATPESWSLGLSRAEVDSVVPQGPARARRYIVLCLGGKGDTQRWDMTSWRRTLVALAPLYGDMGLVAIGSVQEHTLSDDMLALWRGPTENLCGTMTIRQSAAVLTKATLYLGHDSGPMHLAAAMGVRCVAVFCAHNLPGIWFPSGPRPDHQILYHKTPCFGCERQVCTDLQKKCITSITPEEVSAAVSRALA
jgi:heptosyltransferase-3